MVPAPHLPVTGAVWIATIVYVVVLLLVDLLGFNKKAHKIEVREAAWTSAFFVAASLAVNLFVWVYYGHDAGLTFFTAYVLEKSLSVDNLFVIAVLFSYFGVPAAYQHRVLFWGVFGAIVMRAVMIFVGVALVERFDWVLYVFGVFLVLTGARMVVGQDEPEQPGHNPILRSLRRVLPVTKGYHGEHFFIRKLGRLWVTPLFLVLVMIELTDVVFAVDSIPAILGLTTDPYLAFSSNILAVVGLRALYFLLAGIIERVRYLHIGLGVVLVFIGVKMLLHHVVYLPTWLSLLVIVGILTAATVLSWMASARDRRRLRQLAQVPAEESDPGAREPQRRNGSLDHPQTLPREPEEQA